jgi:cephalosporin-C deacetylase-like acetyl esterase
MPLKRISAALLFCALSCSAQPASGRASIDLRYKLFQENLVRRAEAITRAFPGDITTLAEWQRRRPEIKKQFLYVLGLDPMPAKTPLKAQVTGGFERDGYRVENIVFQSMPRLYITGNLYLPAGKQGRLPTVLYLCGHSPGPWGAKVRYQHHGIWFARHGYAAFLIDTIEFGEVAGIHHGTHDLEMWDWLSLGYTPAGPEVWNAIRALDYLETRPEVDPKRVSVTGISGGGAITWFTAAADERFQVAAPVCSTWTVEHHTALDAVQENCDCIYFRNPFLADLPVVGALIAPRPLKMLSARRDPSFPVAGYKEVYKRVRPIYELYGAAEKVAEYDHDAPHSDILPFRKEANEWINRWIRNDPTPFDEGEIKREEFGPLTVLKSYPPDAVNGYIEKIFIPSARPEAPKSLDAWKQRRTKVLAELKDKALRAFPKTKAPFEPWKEVAKEWTDNYCRPYYVQFNTEENLRVTGKLFLPKTDKPARPVLLYVKGKKDVVYPIDYDPLLGAFGSHAILELEPRGVDYPMSNYKEANVKMTFGLLGGTIETMQTWDVLRSLDYLAEVEKLDLSNVSIYARKEMGVPALYAAILDDRIKRVILDDPPSSHWQGPAILNALRFTDLAEVASMVAPRELVTLTPLPDAWRMTTAVYALHGPRARLRRAHALADALEVWKHQ